MSGNFESLGVICLFAWFVLVRDVFGGKGEEDDDDDDDIVYFGFL